MLLAHLLAHLQVILALVMAPHPIVMGVESKSICMNPKISENNVSPTDLTPAEPQGVNLRSPLMIAGILVVVALSIWIFLSLRSKEMGPESSETLTTYRAALKNEEFATGEALAKAGNFEAALGHFETALQNNTSQEAEPQIVYSLALAESMSFHDPERAIVLLKGLAENTSHSDFTRAYAIQQLGLVFYRHGDVRLSELIFSGDPYSKFRDEGGDDGLAYRRLFEYALSFAPLGQAQMRAANWYANELIRLSKKEVLTSAELEQVSAYTERVRALLAEVDLYVESNKTNELTGPLVPDVIARKAQVLGNVYLSGDRTFLDPEKAYNFALGVVANQSAEPATRLNYAGFLARAYGEDRRAKIQSLLSIFMEPSAQSEYKVLMNVFAEAKNDTIGNKETIRLLGQIDSDFKKLLLDLGWSEADFSR